MSFFVTWAQCLFAVVLCLLVGFIAFSHALRWLPEKERMLRWCATGVWSIGSLILLGLLLLNLGIFRWFVAFPALLVVGAFTHLWTTPFSQVWAVASGDLREAFHLIMETWKTRYPWFVVGVLVAVVLVCRTLLLPPLAWDTLTYHATKASLYVQSGSLAMPLAPSGWSWYRLFPPGGEVLQAWAVLPFHHDALFSFVDVGVYLYAALALYATGRCLLGLSRATSLLGLGVVFAMPVMWRALGSGYVDVLLHASLLQSLLFTWLFLQADEPNVRQVGLILSWTAMGIAMSVKLTSYPVVALLVLGQLGVAWRMHKESVSFLKRFTLLGGFIVVLFTLPWMSYNVGETGLPLSPYPLSIAGLAVGKAPPSLQEYSKNPYRQKAYTWEGESQALLKAFLATDRKGNWSWRTSFPTLGGATLLLLLFFPFGWWMMIRRSRGIGILVSLIMAGVLVGFYHDGFSMIRIGWSTSNGRFLLSFVWLALLLSLVFLSRFFELSRWLSWIVGALCLWNVWDVALYISPHEWWPLARLLVGSVCVVGLVVWMQRRLSLSPAQLSISMVFVVSLALAGAFHVKASFRVQAFQTSEVLHRVPRYWTKCLKALESLPGQKVAVTAGHAPQHDNWFLYPWMGRSLQHQWVYVSPLRTSAFVDYRSGYYRRFRRWFDRALWIKRLRQQGVRYVVALYPYSIEAKWMHESPKQFKPMAQFVPSWGCYRLRSSKPSVSSNVLQKRQSK